jgi:hypothetical protein
LVVAVVVAVLLNHGGKTSESSQAATDIRGGAVEPLADGKDCPVAYPVKANYRSDRGTRYLFTTSDGEFYDETTPTSCWRSVSAAEDGGYRHPPK